jgi:DNA-binding beta-propeller fold protein YncE
MDSKGIIHTLGSASLLFASLVLAADLPTGAPNQTAQLDLLLMPSDVAIAGNGQTYVVDSGNHQVAVFDASGTRVTSLGMMGGEDGQLLNPLGIGVSAKGEVWVADKGNERVVMFDAKARPRAAFELEADGEGIVPVDIAIGPQGKELLITSNNTHQVVVFSTKGEFLRAWGGEGEDGAATVYDTPVGLAASGSRLYVTQMLAGKVAVLEPQAPPPPPPEEEAAE